MAKPCVQVRVAVRRVVRHPLTQRTFRTGVIPRKHVVRGAPMGLVTDAVNDVAFHHAQLNIDEIMHIMQDTASISSMTAVLAALMVVSKFSQD